VGSSGRRTSHLSLAISDEALGAACEEGRADIELRGMTHLVDPRVGALVAAVNAERIAGFPSGRLFLDSVEQALAVALVGGYAVRSRSHRNYRGGLGPARLRTIKELVHAKLEDQPADAILAAGDLVITIGYDPVEYWPSIWNKGNKRPIVHLDVLPADIDNSYSPSVELIGDIAASLRLLTPQVSHSTPEPSITRLLEKTAQDREELARSSAALNGTPVHPLRLVSELQKILTPSISGWHDISIASERDRFSSATANRPWV
jgi:hypothetical protein